MLVFDELYTLEYIKKAIKKAFKTTEWKRKFGGKEMKFVDDEFGESTTFPVCYVAIFSQNEATDTYDSSQEEKFTRFDFEIECFNQETTDSTKLELGVAINKQLVMALKGAFNPHITFNQRISSQDETIYRRRVEGYAIIDNKNKIFYR